MWLLSALLFSEKMQLVPANKGIKLKSHYESATNMRLLCLFLAVIITAIRGVCGDQTPPQANTNGVVFREPFTLKLHVDKEHYYEQAFLKIPFVYQGDVYLFKGDAFGIDLDITNGTIRGISYQADTNKAAVTLRFTQEVREDGDLMMLLVIKNQTNRELFVDALMTVPEKETARETSILPLRPGLVGYESWPHPIVQLVLRNIRLQEKSGTEQNGAVNARQPIHSETNQTSPAAGSRR
jgi:hypothetical protein